MRSDTRSNKLVFYNLMGTILLYAISFISAPIFSRLLGVVDYGIVQVYNTWVSFFVVFIGLYTRGTLAIAKTNLSEEEQYSYQSSVLCMSLLGFTVISAIILIFSRVIIPFFGFNLLFLVLMLLHSFGTYCIYFINTKYTYELKAKNNLVISVVLSLANFGFSFCLIKMLTNNAYNGRIIGMAIPYILAGFIVVIHVIRKGRTGYSRRYWKFCAPLCFPLILHGISGIICASSDRVMISKMIGNSAVGIYSLAYNYCNIMDSLWSALHNSWDPFFFEYLKNNELEKLREISHNYMRLFSCLSIGFILLSPEVFRIFASEAYWEGAKIIPFIVTSIYAVFLYAFAANYEFAMKRTDVIAIGSVIAGIANVILNLLLIPLLGYLGAGIATLLSNILLMVVHFIFAKKLAGKSWIYNIRFFIPYVIGLMAAVILFYMCWDKWLIRWAIGLIVGFYMVIEMIKNKSIF